MKGARGEPTRRRARRWYRRKKLKWAGRKSFRLECEVSMRRTKKGDIEDPERKGKAQ